MLGRLGNQAMVNAHIESPSASLYKRNEKEDMKIALDALFEFKRKLDELHPHCLDMMTLLLNSRY